MTDITDIPADRLVAAHIRLTEEKSALAAIVKKLNEDLDADIESLETTLLGMLNRQGQDSFRACGKTVAKFEEVLPNGKDWVAIRRFVIDNNAWDMLGKRVGKTWVNKYAKDNGGKLPPGVEVHREWKVKITKAPTKTDDVVGQDA